MREYELTFIIQPEISEEGREELLDKFGGQLDRTGGARLAVEDHGKRKLAYEISRFQKGHYLTLSFLDDGKSVPELERAMRLEESVLRFLTVLVEPEVDDVEARKAHAVEQERIRRERAAERAAREAEERAAREAEERTRLATQPPAEAPASEEAESEKLEDVSIEERTNAEDSDGDEEAS